MSKQSSRSLFGASKNILRDGLHFVALGVKVAKTVAVADENGYLYVKAGTVLTSAGAVMTAADANAADAYGVVYEDVNFDDVPDGGNETVSVVVHGIVEIGRLPAVITAAQKTAMKGLQFVV